MQLEVRVPRARLADSLFDPIGRAAETPGPGVHDQGGQEEEGEHAHEQAEGNPHLWLDVENAERYVDRIIDALAGADPSDVPPMVPKSMS